MIWIVLYILGLIFFLPRQLKIESAQRAIDLAEQKKYFPSEFDLKVRNQALTPSPPMPLPHLGMSPSSSGLHAGPHSPTSSHGFSSSSEMPRSPETMRTSFSTPRMPQTHFVQQSMPTRGGAQRKPSDPFADFGAFGLEEKPGSHKGSHKGGHF